MARSSTPHPRCDVSGTSELLLFYALSSYLLSLQTLGLKHMQSRRRCRNRPGGNHPQLARTPVHRHHRAIRQIQSQLGLFVFSPCLRPSCTPSSETILTVPRRQRNGILHPAGPSARRARGPGRLFAPPPDRNFAAALGDRDVVHARPAAGLGS